MKRLLISLSFLSLSLIGGCSTNPSTGRSQFIVVSASAVSQMGAEAKPELIKQYGGEAKSKDLRDYVTRVGRRVAREAEPEYQDIEWEFITLDSDVINAFALPGGRVFISRGLLAEFDNEAQVAGVLGHEIGHVTARHIDERISQSIVAQIGLEVVGQVSETQIISTGVGMLTQGTLLSFGRSQESEADRQGLKYMTRAGYDPMGLAEVMEVLIAASEGSSQWEILSTHPDPNRRLADAMELIDSEYSFTQGNSEYRKFPSRFRRNAAPYLSAPSTGSVSPEYFAGWCAVCAASPHANQ